MFPAIVPSDGIMEFIIGTQEKYYQFAGASSICAGEFETDVMRLDAQGKIHKDQNSHTWDNDQQRLTLLISLEEDQVFRAGYFITSNDETFEQIYEIQCLYCQMKAPSMIANEATLTFELSSQEADNFTALIDLSDGQNG